MPIPDHSHRSGRSWAFPGRAESRMERLWPAVIAVAAILVFIAFLVQAGPLLAVVMAGAIVVAATILVTLVTGTAWLARVRDLVPRTRGHR